MSVLLEIVLTSGERRTIALPGPTDSVANALDRLDAWIQTTDGGWVQKRFIVEVRPAQRIAYDRHDGSSDEFARLADAAATLTDQARSRSR